MPRREHDPEEIVVCLRRLYVAVAQGGQLSEAERGIGVIEVPHRSWRND